MPPDAQPSSYRARLESRVSRYNPADRDELFEFHRREFGPHSIQADPAFFQWRFFENPHLRSDGPQLWLYRQDGRIRGVQAGLPVQVKVGDGEVRGSWAIDLQIEVDYRNRGVGGLLSRALTRDNDLTMGLGIRDEARVLFRKAGWLDGGAVPLYFLPLDVSTILRTRFHPRWGPMLGAMARPALGLLDATRPLSQRSTQLWLAEVDRFDERADRLWADISRDYKVLVVRDAT